MQSIIGQTQEVCGQVCNPKDRSSHPDPGANIKVIGYLCTMQSEIIRATGVSLSYNGNRVLRNLDFRIDRGENVCFSGPSGKGKSTVLKMLQGYVIPDSGTVSVNGKNIGPETIKDIRKLMAYIPQNINLPVENGAQLLNLLGYATPGESFYRLAGKLGVDMDTLSRSFDEISGGQKQRIVIAVCLSLEKEVILMDEPTSSLDDDSIDRLVEVVRSLEDKTVITASHNYRWLNSAGKVITL